MIHLFFFVQGAPGGRGFPGADGGAGPKVRQKKHRNIAGNFEQLLIVYFTVRLCSCQSCLVYFLHILFLL